MAYPHPMFPIIARFELLDIFTILNAISLIISVINFDIPYGTHHRAGDDAEMCARLFLREIKDAGWVEFGRKWIIVTANSK